MASSKNKNDLVRVYQPNGRIETRRTKGYSIPTSSRSSRIEENILHYTNKHHTEVCRCLQYARHKNPSPVAAVEDEYLEASLTRYLVQRGLESCAISAFRDYEQSKKLGWSLLNLKPQEFHYVDESKDLVCRCAEGRKHGVGFVQHAEIRDLCAEFFVANREKMTCCREEWRRVKSGEYVEGVQERGNSSAARYDQARVYLHGRYCDGSHECYPLSPHSSDSDSDSDSSLSPTSPQMSRANTLWSVQVPLTDQYKDPYEGRALLQAQTQQRDANSQRAHGTRGNHDASMAYLRNGPGREPDIPEHVWRNARPSLHTGRRDSGSAISTLLGTEVTPVVRIGVHTYGNESSGDDQISAVNQFSGLVNNADRMSDPVSAAKTHENRAAQFSAQDATYRLWTSTLDSEGTGIINESDIADAYMGEVTRFSLGDLAPSPSLSSMSKSEDGIINDESSVSLQESQTQESRNSQEADEYKSISSAQSTDDVDAQDPALWPPSLTKSPDDYQEDGPFYPHGRSRSLSTGSTERDVFMKELSLDSTCSQLSSGSGAQASTSSVHGEMESSCLRGNEQSEEQCLGGFPEQEVYENNLKEIFESGEVEICESEVGEIYESGAREVHESDSEDGNESGDEQVYDDDDEQAVGNGGRQSYKSDTSRDDAKERNHSDTSAPQDFHGDYILQNHGSDTMESRDNIKDGGQDHESDSGSIYEDDQTQNEDEKENLNNDNWSKYEKEDELYSLDEHGDGGNATDLDGLHDKFYEHDEMEIFKRDSTPAYENDDDSLSSTESYVDGPASQLDELDEDTSKTNEAQTEHISNTLLHEENVESHSISSLDDEKLQRVSHELDSSVVEKLVTTIDENYADQTYDDDEFGSVHSEAEKSRSSSRLDDETNTQYSYELDHSMLLPNPYEATNAGRYEVPSIPDADLSLQANRARVDTVNEGELELFTTLTTLESEPALESGAARFALALNLLQEEDLEDSMPKQRKRCSIRTDRSSVGSALSTQSFKGTSMIFRRIKPESFLPNEEDFFNRNVMICSRTNPAPLGVCSLCHASLNKANYKTVKIPVCQHYFHRRCLLSHFRVRDREWEACPDCGEDLCVRDLDDRVDADRVAIFKGRNTNLREGRIDIVMPMDGTIMTCETQEAIAAAHLRIIKDYVFLHAEKLYIAWQDNRKVPDWFNNVVLPASKDFKKWNNPTRQHGFLIPRDEFQKVIIWSELVRLMTTIRAEKRKTSEPFPDLAELYDIMKKAKTRYDEHKKKWVRKHAPEPEYDKIAKYVFDLADTTYNNDLL